MCIFADKNAMILKRASTHRPGGPWDDDDYDVYNRELARHECP